MRLGKKEFVDDARTLRMANFMAPEIRKPAKFDWDKGRSPFPLRPMGNDAWGNCVKVGQTNHLLRLERIEQRRTLAITDPLIIQAYKDEVQRQFGEYPISPGDRADNGLVVLWNLRNWRSLGWDLQLNKKTPARKYSIAAFGLLNVSDYDQLKTAIYLFHGIQLGLDLPLSAQDQWRQDVPWSVVEGQRSTEGSWGGHLVYAKAYDPTYVEIITWGRRVLVTYDFIGKYCDEAWATVDSFNTWSNRPEVDVSGIVQYLREIGAQIIE